MAEDEKVRRASPSDEPPAEGDDEDDAKPRARRGKAKGPPDAAKPAPASEGAYHPSYVFLAVVALVSLVLDLGTKHWAKASLEDPKPPLTGRIEVVKDHFDLIFAKNRGGAFGFLQDADEGTRRPFFLLVSIAAVVFIFTLYRKLQRDQWALKWGLPLVLGGAVGNFVDRIRYGYVVDFIDLYVTTGGRERHWPTFNIADIAICVGVGLMAIDMFTPRKAEVPASPELPESPRPASRPAKGA